MSRFKSLERELLLKYGYVKKEPISKDEYDKLRKIDPDQVVAYDGIDSTGLTYYQYRIDRSYNSEDIEKIIKLDNNKALNNIEHHVRVIKNIVLACFIGGIIGGIILIIMNSSS